MTNWLKGGADQREEYDNQRVFELLRDLIETKLNLQRNIEELEMKVDESLKSKKEKSREEHQNSLESLLHKVVVCVCVCGEGGGEE